MLALVPLMAGKIVVLEFSLLLLPKGKGPSTRLDAMAVNADDFVRRINRVGEPETPVDQVHLMRIIEAAYESAESGREVDL